MRNRTRISSLDAFGLRDQRDRIYPALAAGDGSILSLDFTTMSSLDSSLFTFSRSTNPTPGASFIGSDGLVQYAGTNVPRFDYDPTTLEPRGLLLEGSVTNLITYSNASTTGWTGLSATGSNNNATSPDGTTSATLWTGQSGGQNRVYSGTFNVTSGSAYTVSAWFKKPASNGSRYVKIYVLASNESGIGWPSDGVLDLNTGTASGTGFTVTPYSNNWYRVVSTGTPTSTTTARAFIAMCTSTGGLLTTTESMLVWGCQAETGTRASSYVFSDASQGQRSADSALVEGSKFSTWWTSPTEYSVFVDMIPMGIVPSQFPDPYRLINRTTTSNTSHFFYYGSSTYTMESRLSNPTTNVSSQAVSGQSFGSRIKVAHAIGAGVHLLSFNGTTKTTTTLASVPTGLNALGIMANGLAGSTSTGHACIRAIKIWPSALSQAQLNGLTA